MSGTYARYSGFSSAGGGVTSLNTLAGALTLSAGTGISITDNGVSTITIASTSAGDVTLTAFGSSPNADGASLTGQALTLQPASATFPGGVTTAAQSFAGDKTFVDSILVNTIDTPTPGTIALGTGTANVVNIGNSGSTVNINGTVLYENVTQLQVTDPLITLNKGGGTGSASDSGIEIEEGGSITAYSTTSSDRNSWKMKAPNTAGVATVTPGVAGITLDQSSHNPVTLGTANGLSLATQVLSLGLSSTSTTGALSSTDWNTFNSKQAALTIGNLTAAGTDGIVVTNGTGAVIGTGTSISQQQSDATHNGYLSSADWATFNAKQDALTLPLSVANGGTGLTSGTSGGILGFTAAGTLASSAALIANQLVVGGGAGATPTTLAAGSQYQVLTMGASVPAYGALDIGQSAAVTGTLLAAQFPALTGDVTTSAGSLATTAAATQANIATLSKSTGVAVHGTNTNDNAAAGYVGEYVSATSAGVSVAASTAYANITSISLTAGDWDVDGLTVLDVGTAVNVGGYVGGISTSNSALDSTNVGGWSQLGFTSGTIVGQTAIALGNRRFSLTSTTTVYLIGRITYTSAGTASWTSNSIIRARRIR